MRNAAVFLLALLLLGGCSRRDETPSGPSAAALAAEAANRVAPRPVILYFAGPSGLLVPERRNLPLPESAAAAVGPIARAVIGGSANAGVPKLFPEDTAVRGAWVLPEGTVVVDLGGATIQEGWTTGSTAEMLAAYSLVQTLVANIEGAERVRILIGGQPATTLGGHLDLSRSLRARRDLVEQGEAPAGGASR